MNVMSTSRTTSASRATRAVLAGLLALVTASALSLIGAPPASAATPTVRQWTGAGADGNWTNPANWLDGAPVAGDILRFGYNRPRRTNVNNFPADTTFRNIEFGDTGYALGGNRVRLTSGIGTYNDTFSPWTERVNLAIVVANSQSFTAGEPTDTITYSGGFVLTADATFSGGGNQVVTGPVTGTGAIVNAAGILTLAGTSATTGPTKITGGAVVVTGSYPGRPVSIEGFGKLAGSGSTGSVRGSQQGFVYPVCEPFPTPAVIQVTGDLTFSSSAGGYVIAVNSALPSHNSQLVVTGRVTLANALLGVQSSTTSKVVVGQVLTIVKNNGPGPVSGTFFNFPQGSTVRDTGYMSNVTYRISYTGGPSGRDVTLTVLTM